MSNNSSITQSRQQSNDTKINSQNISDYNTDPMQNLNSHRLKRDSQVEKPIEQLPLNKSFDYKATQSRQNIIRTQILDKKQRYNSLDQARQHLRDVIQNSKNHVNQAKNRELLNIREEIMARDNSRSYIGGQEQCNNLNNSQNINQSTRSSKGISNHSYGRIKDFKNSLHDQSSGNIYNQSNQHSFRSSGGSCSYKMPKIKVSSNEEVFQNLKKILVDLKGNSSLLFSKRKGNYENSQADMSFYQSQLPDIIIVDEKKKKLKEQEQKQIEKSINQFKTLKDLNESLLKLPKHHSHTTNNSPTRQFSKKTIFQSIRESKANLLQRNESIEILNPLLDRKPSQEPTVFHTNNLFQLNYDKSCLEKFYKYKSEMKDKDGFRVSIKSCYDEKLIIFLGEAASFVKIDEITAQYIGGLSVHANNDILEFENLNYQVSWKSLQQPYFKQNSAQDMSYLLRRNGHTSLYYKEKIVIFGGEKGKTIGPSLRDLTNDLLILDPSTNDIFRQTYDRALLYNRMYHQAFIIDDSLFIFGGQTNGSKPLDELIEIDLNTYIYSKQEIENIQLVGAITNHKCCPVFYPSRHHKDSRISMKKLAQEVNWSESEHFIQQEGIYLFGGRNINNETQGKLFVMTITFNNQNKPIKRFIEPLTQGQTPPARYMHSMDYYKQGNLLVIVGGRNDQLHDYQITSLQQSYSQYILDDIWILKLSNLEWQRISPSNQYTELVKPRFNFCSVILGSTLIIAGGIGKDFKLLKDYQEIELDQSKIKKRSQNYVQINKNNNSRLIGGLRNNKEGSESNLSKSKMQKYEDLLKSKK